MRISNVIAWKKKTTSDLGSVVELQNFQEDLSL